jgi:hypothetical protein
MCCFDVNFITRNTSFTAVSKAAEKVVSLDSDVLAATVVGRVVVMEWWCCE